MDADSPRTQRGRLRIAAQSVCQPAFAVPEQYMRPAEPSLTSFHRNNSLERKSTMVRRQIIDARTTGYIKGEDLNSLLRRTFPDTNVDQFEVKVCKLEHKGLSCFAEDMLTVGGSRHREDLDLLCSKSFDGRKSVAHIIHAGVANSRYSTRSGRFIDSTRTLRTATEYIVSVLS